MASLIGRRLKKWPNDIFLAAKLIILLILRPLLRIKISFLLSVDRALKSQGREMHEKILHIYLFIYFYLNVLVPILKKIFL